MQRARRTRRHPPAAKAPEIRGNAAADRGDGRCGVGRRSDLARARNRGRGRPRRAPPSPHREATAGPGRRFVPKYKQIAAEADRRRKAGEGFDRLAREMKVSRGTFLRAYDFANRDEAAAAEAPAPVSRGVRSESQAQVRRHGARHRECRQAARCCDRWACGRRTCGGPRYHRRLLRLTRQTPISRHFPTPKAKLMARVGEEFPLECPGCGGDIRLIAFRLLSECETIPGALLATSGCCGLPVREPGADPEGPHASGRTARASASLSCPWPAHRLGRARPGPLSTGRFFRRHPSSCPQSTSTASDGIPCHGADGPRAERFQGWSAPTRKAGLERG
jgi:hypothetical protein